MSPNRWSYTFLLSRFVLTFYDLLQFEQYLFLLQKLSVYSTDVRGNYSLSILKSCPLVEKLTLCHCDSLTDDDFFEVLETNPLSNCKDLCLLLAPYLTIRSIWTAMTCCDK